MGSHFLIAVACTACSAFFWQAGSVHPGTDSLRVNSFRSFNDIIGFKVQRMSGARVLMSWHTEYELENIRFEVMRKHGKGVPYVSLGVVEPKAMDASSADYSFVDPNDFSDSSYYCLKKTSADHVIFYSLAKGVEGVGKER